MFPPSLHKNIRELDKQITLLESECENMESEKRKKAVNGRLCQTKSNESTGCLRRLGNKDDAERPFLTAPRFPDNVLYKRTSRQLSTTKLRPKSCINSKDTAKKVLISKEVSTTTCDEQNNKHKNNDRNCPACGSNRERPRSASKKDKTTQGATRCSCGKELLNGFDKDVNACEGNVRHSEFENENHILHKGILHANPGSAIEVTVTQKSLKPPASASKGLTCKLTSSNTNAVVERRDSELCNLKEKPSSSEKYLLSGTPRGQKWSEILSQGSDSSLCKRWNGKKLINDNSQNVKSLDHLHSECKKHFASEEGKVDAGNLKSNKLDKELMTDVWSENDENARPQVPASSSPRKLRRATPFSRRNIENAIDISPRTLKIFEEKETENNSEPDKSDLSEESFDPMRTLCDLADALRGKCSEDEKRRLFNELKSYVEEGTVDAEEEKKSAKDKVNDDYEMCINQDNDYVKKLRKHFWSTKKLCDKLTKEKLKLTEDLAVKDRLLANLNAKEKEYLSAITNLRLNLEKKKVQAEDNMEMARELNLVKNKLINETKVSDALRKSHAKMQEEAHKCTLENDKLKTQIRLSKLESQKFCVLLAGKDAEIKRYRDEVESFQRQITDQLAALRSNNAAAEVQKAMEAIMQHSQAVSTTDLDSAFSDTQTEDRALRSSSRNRDKPIHSSPTSTKSSLLDSSWNHISSIHEGDFRSDGEGIDDEGDNGNRRRRRRRRSPPGARDRTEDEVLIGDLRPTDRSRPSDADHGNHRSFVSCKSADDLSMTGLMSRIDSGEPRKSGEFLPAALNDDLRRNIEELFNEIKLKCSKKVFSVPSDSLRFDDLLNSSQTSDFSEVSGSFFVSGRTETQ